MSPIPDFTKRWVQGEKVPIPTNPGELVLEAWAMGYLVGSLVIMSFITLANMRRGVLLHKVSFLLEFSIQNDANLTQLILLEVSCHSTCIRPPSNVINSLSWAFGKASIFSLTARYMHGGYLCQPSSSMHPGLFTTSLPG